MQIQTGGQEVQSSAPQVSVFDKTHKIQINFKNESEGQNLDKFDQTNLKLDLEDMFSSRNLPNKRFNENGNSRNRMRQYFL